MLVASPVNFSGYRMTSKTFDQLDKNTKHALDVLARKFESARKVDEKGRTVFDGTSTLALPEVLGGLGVIPDILPDTVQRRLANQAAFKAAQSGPITARSLWLATQSGYKEYLKTPLTRYILATTLPTGSVR